MPQAVESAAAMAVHMTKAEVALAFLRARIQSGELASGERLQAEALAGELDMSATPIREALRLLQADGLVTYHPHRGVVVAETSIDTALEILRLRTLLESLATELAVPQLTTQDIAELRTLQDQLRRATIRGSVAKLSELNHAWHWKIYAKCQSPILLEFVRRLWEAFPWRTIWASSGRAENSALQHEDVMQALAAGNARLAAERMRNHIEAGVTEHLEQLRQIQAHEKAAATASHLAEPDAREPA